MRTADEILAAYGLDPATATGHQVEALRRFLHAKALAEQAEADFLAALREPKPRPRLLVVEPHGTGGA